MQLHGWERTADLGSAHAPLHRRADQWGGITKWLQQGQHG